MSFFDKINSIGNKISAGVNGAANIGSKMWKGANAIGQKVSDVAQSALDNPVISAALASDPELDMAIRGGVKIGQQALKVSQGVEQFASGGLQKPVKKQPTTELDDMAKRGPAINRPPKREISRNPAEARKMALMQATNADTSLSQGRTGNARRSRTFNKPEVPYSLNVLPAGKPQSTAKSGKRRKSNRK
jgi:hypothetical protein